MMSPSFNPLSSALFPFAHFLGEKDTLNYQSYSGISKESNQSHHLSRQTQFADGLTQTMQSQFNHPLHHHHQTISSSNIINPDYRTMKANSDYSLFTDCPARHGKRERILKSNMSGAAPPGKRVQNGATNSSSEYGGGTSRKFRIKWTHELHNQFVAAVNSLGGPMKATPKGILERMKIPGLTTFHIKSHLQKYRTTKGKPSTIEGRSGKSNCPQLPLSNVKGSGGFQITETLQLQMNVRKSLHEHLEFQKELQTRIEDHANYLQRVFDQQKETCSYLNGKC